MSNITSSITDIPRNSKDGDKDNFGISPYERGLVRFISNANTPVTIALQGEWGSGKTSLMNSLQESLSDKENAGALYHSVWLNTWEYALMKDAPDTLMSIITGLIKEISDIANADPTTTQKMVKKLWGVGKDTMKFAAKKAADQVVSGSSALIDNMLADTSTQSSISEVRDELEKMIANTIEKDGKLGVIFFIDDLDRIDPPVAVQLLELLKNIFTINNCVFVLAIDYDVVIKGLEPKFGKFTAKNEREFRSFFDKIIQVPFSMPVGSYSVNTFLKESLATIDYLSESKCNDENLISALSQIAELTVGTNPRALKRLLNSLSLINSINQSKDGDERTAMNDDLSLLVNFALVSMQISYPMIYRLLNNYPAFDEWDERIALQMSLPLLNAQEKEKLAQSEAFDEEWEQVVFRICESDYYLKKRALHISNLLNLLRDKLKEYNASIEETIEAVISLSSVTNLEAFDTPKKTQKDMTKFEFKGAVYNKSRLVHEVVKQYAVLNPAVTYAELEQVFPATVQGKLGVFTTQENAEGIFKNTGYKRHYIKAKELIKIGDNVIATCNQWGVDNIGNFVKCVNGLGIEGFLIKAAQK